MSSPYGPSGGQDPQQPWGQQPYGGQVPGTPSGGFPAQGGYPPPQGYPGPQQQYPGYGQPQQPQPTQQYPAGGYGQSPYGEQQQYQGYGQPQQQQYPGQGGPQPKKKSGALLWIIVAVAVLAVGAVLVLGFVTPGWFNSKTLDHVAVQEGVKKVVIDTYDADSAKIESVTCPEGQPVKLDHRFTCTLKYDGKDFTVDIVVRDAEKAVYEVADPSLPE